MFNSCINPLVYGGFYIKSLRKRQQSSGLKYNTVSGGRCTTHVTYTGNDNADKQQQTPGHKREASYKDKIFSSNASDSKKKEKVVNCKEFQVVVTDYS